MSVPCTTSGRSGEFSSRAEKQLAGRRLAQAEESGLGAQVRGIFVVGGRADSAEQNGCGIKAGCERVGRKRVIAGGKGSASDVLAGELEFVPEGGGDGLEDADSLLGDFGANAVTGDEGEVKQHVGSP